MAERAPSPVWTAAPMAGGTCWGWLGDGEGTEEGRGSGRQTRGPQPLPCLRAPPWARGLGLPRSPPARERGEGKGNGARRYVTGARGLGCPRAGGRRGTRGQTPERAREAPRVRARCARGRVTRPSPHLCVCLSVCLVCASVSVSVTWGLRCRHNTGPPGRAGASEAVPQLSARAEGSLQGNRLEGEKGGSPSPGAAVPSGTLPALQQRVSCLRLPVVFVTSCIC